MTNFQRMIVIPQEEYLQLTAIQNVKEPLSQQFYKLENKYESSANIGDPYKRLLIQSETLDEMKELKERMRESIKVSTPKPYRNRATALFESINSFIKFNNRGEIFDKEENVIVNSRI